MKQKVVLLLALVLCLVIPAFAEMRVDLGFDIPRGVGNLSTTDSDISEDTIDFFNKYIFPFPEAAVYYQSDRGSFRFGGGLRAYTLILGTIFWPNVYCEADLWKFTFELQAGGGMFGTFGLYNSLNFGKVFIPDLSAWFRIGKTFRIGGGAMGLIAPEISDTDMLFVYYFGLKFTLKP